MSEKATSNEQNQEENTSGFVDQEWPPFQGSMGEEMSDEDRERYEKRLSGEAAEEEGEFGGETNETYQTGHPKVVRDAEGNPILDEEGKSVKSKIVYDADGNPVKRIRAAEGNPFEYTPKVEGEDNAAYGARLRWQKMMAEKIATDPMSDEDIRYKENGERDIAASEAAWRERVGVPSLDEYRNGGGEDTGAEDGGGTEDESDEARKAAEQSLVDTLNQVLQKKAEEAGAEEPLKPFDVKDIENPTGDDLAYEAWLKSNAMPEEEPEQPEETGPDKPFDTRDIENPTQDDLSYEAWLRSNANPDQLDRDGNPTGAVTPEKPFDINDIENPTEDDKAYEAWLKSNANPELGSEVRQDEGETEDSAEYDPTKSRWSQMTEDEKYALLHKYPRLEGENTNDWGKRIEAAEGHRIFGVDGEKAGAENPEDAEKKDNKENKENEEDKEKLKKELMRKLSEGAIADWVQKEKGLTRGDLDGLSTEELQKLIDEYEKSKGQEDKEAQEKLKKELMRKLSEGAIADWVQKEKGLTRGDLDKMSTEELQKLIDEYNQRGKAGAGKEPGKEPDGEKKPKTKEVLIASNVDLERDAKTTARMMAEARLAEKLKGKGRTKVGRWANRLAKGIVFGAMFREGVLQRYQKDAMSQIIAKQRGESSELKDNEWSGSKAGIERFVAAYVEGMRDEMISTDAGEKMDVYGLETDDDGEEHAYRYSQDEEGNRTKERLADDSLEAESTRSMRDAIAEYAQGKLTKEQFENQMRMIQQDMNGEGANTDLMIDNFMGVAEAAKERYDHEESIESVMDGFTFINGEARRNVRTEAHRDALDKITERLSQSRIGRLLPPEVLGTAASLATMGGRTALSTGLIAAGSIVVGTAMAPAVVPVAVAAATAGVFGAIKERNRSATDREMQGRRLAQSDAAGVEKYDLRMLKSQYAMKSAGEYTKRLSDAMESGDTEAIKTALATAEAATRLSDRGRIDLIRYSSGDTDVIEQERMNLAVQRAKAKAELKRQGIAFDSDVMTRAIEGAAQSFERDISAKDKIFRKVRRGRVAMQGTVSAAVGAAGSVVMQEIVAMLNPNLYGLGDALFNIKNNEGATSTLLAGALGLNHQVIPINVEAAQGVEGMTQAQKDQLRSEGYTVKDRTVASTEVRDVSSSEYFEANGDSQCDGWMNNGTSGSDGTELQGYFTDHVGPHTIARGVATDPSTGRVYDMGNVDERFGFYIRATKDSAPIHVNYVRNGNSIDIDTTGLDQPMVDMIENGTFYQAQGGYSLGVDEAGVDHFASIFSFRGSNSVPETITTTVDTSKVVTDVFGYNKTVDTPVTGFPFLGAARRKNLTLGKSSNAKKPKVRVPTGARVPVDDKPKGGGQPPKGPATPPKGPTPPNGGETPPKTDDGAEIIDIYTTPPGFGERQPATNGASTIERAPKPAAAEATPKAPKAEAPAETNDGAARIVRPGDIELPGIPTKAYEMVDADSHATLVEISDDDLKALVPENRVATAKVAIDRWNSIPSDLRRKYLEADSDEAAGLDADSLDIAKTAEAFGLIKSNHAGELASGVTAAPEHGAHADALDEIDPDAIWEDGSMPEYTKTIDLYTPGDIRVSMTDDKIRQLAHNPIMSKEELDEVRSAIYNWNSAFEEEQRRILANSRYKSKMVDEGSLKKLEDLGIIERQSYKYTFTIKDSKGRPTTFTPGFERSANNNTRAFKPEKGRQAA